MTIRFRTIGEARTDLNVDTVDQYLDVDTVDQYLNTDTVGQNRCRVSRYGPASEVSSRTRSESRP